MKKHWFELAGDILSIAIPAAVLGWLLLEGLELEAAKFGVAYVLANLITHLIKILTFAPRPEDGAGEWIKWKFSIKKGNSFPSGHTTSAMSGAVYSGYALDPIVSFVFMVLAILVGMSRIHAAAHFHRDVFYGFVIAQLTAAAVFSNIFGCVNWLVRALS